MLKLSRVALGDNKTFLSAFMSIFILFGSNIANSASQSAPAITDVDIRNFSLPKSILTVIDEAEKLAVRKHDEAEKLAVRKHGYIKKPNKFGPRKEVNLLSQSLPLAESVDEFYFKEGFMLCLKSYGVPWVLRTPFNTINLRANFTIRDRAVKLCDNSEEFIDCVGKELFHILETRLGLAASESKCCYTIRSVDGDDVSAPSDLRMHRPEYDTGARKLVFNQLLEKEYRSKSRPRGV